MLVLSHCRKFLGVLWQVLFFLVIFGRHWHFYFSLQSEWSWADSEVGGQHSGVLWTETKLIPVIVIRNLIELELVPQAGMELFTLSQCAQIQTYVRRIVQSTDTGKPTVVDRHLYLIYKCR